MLLTICRQLLIMCRCYPNFLSELPGYVSGPLTRNQNQEWKCGLDESKSVEKHQTCWINLAEMLPPYEKSLASIFTGWCPLISPSWIDFFVFFELMPCTLEAFIKTFCLGSAILTCWRIGESKKPGVFKIKTRQTQPQTKPKNHKKTPRELGETLRFQKRNPHAARYFFTMTQQFPQIDVPSDSKLWKVVVLHHPSRWTRVVARWFTHVHVDDSPSWIEIANVLPALTCLF